MLCDTRNSSTGLLNREEKKKKKKCCFQQSTPLHCKDLQKGTAALKNAAVESLCITDQRLKLIIKTKAITEMRLFREKSRMLGVLPLW